MNMSKTTGSDERKEVAGQAEDQPKKPFVAGNEQEEVRSNEREEKNYVERNQMKWRVSGRCGVICCTSKKSSNRSKLLFPLPTGEKLRARWLKAVGGRVNYNRKFGQKVVYICEDHFNVEMDLENYIRHKYSTTLKRMSPLRLKKNALPSKFPMCSSRSDVPKHRHILRSKLSKTKEPSQVAPFVQFAMNTDTSSVKPERKDEVASNGTCVASKASFEGRMDSDLIVAEKPTFGQMMELLDGDISDLIARVQPNICSWDVSVVGVEGKEESQDGSGTSGATVQNSCVAQEGELALRGHTMDVKCTNASGRICLKTENDVGDEETRESSNDSEPQRNKSAGALQKAMSELSQDDDEWIPDSDEAASWPPSARDSGSDSEYDVPKKKHRVRPTSDVPSRQSTRLAKRKIQDTENNDFKSSWSTDALIPNKDSQSPLETRFKKYESLTSRANQGSRQCLPSKDFNAKQTNRSTKRTCSTNINFKTQTSDDTNGESDDETAKSDLSQPAAAVTGEMKTETTTLVSEASRENTCINPKWRTKTKLSEGCALGVIMDETVATLQLENVSNAYSFKPVYEKVDDRFERCNKFFIVKENSVDPSGDFESVALPQNVVHLIDNMRRKMDEFFIQMDHLKDRVKELGPAAHECVAYIDGLRSNMMSFPALLELEMSEFALQCHEHYRLDGPKEDELKMERWCSACKKKAQFHCCFRAAYCSVSCQLIHWNTFHKFHCQQATMTLIDESLRLNPVLAARLKAFNNRPHSVTVADLEDYYKFAGQAKAERSQKSVSRKETPALESMKETSVRQRSVTSVKKLCAPNPVSSSNNGKPLKRSTKSAKTSPKVSVSRNVKSPKRPGDHSPTIVASSTASQSQPIEIKAEQSNDVLATDPLDQNLDRTAKKRSPIAVVKDTPKFAFAFKSPQVKVTIPPFLLPKNNPKPDDGSMAAPTIPNNQVALRKPPETLSTTPGTKPLTTTIRCRAVVLPNGKKQYIPVDGQSWPFKTPQGVLTMDPGSQNSVVKSSGAPGSIFITRASKTPGFIQLGGTSPRSISIQNGKFAVRPPGVSLPAAALPIPKADSAQLPSLTPCKPKGVVEKVRTLERNELENILNSDHLKKVFDDSYSSKILTSRP